MFVRFDCKKKLSDPNLLAVGNCKEPASGMFLKNDDVDVMSLYFRARQKGGLDEWNLE